MRAMQYRGIGCWQRLTSAELPRPVPAPAQVLVEVAATSVNPIDWKLHSDPFRWIPSGWIPKVPCFDFAGTIDAVGGQVHRFQRGERVFGMLSLKPQGAAAEFVAVDQDLLARIPHGLDFRSAAGMPLAGLTALQGLRDDGRLRAGQRLLIIGASGGVGHYAVQIGKILGAHVTAMCSTRNVEWVGELGADTVIDYTAGAIPEGTDPFDLIFDGVVSRPFRDWQPWLSPTGTYVSLLPGLALMASHLALRLGSRQAIRFTRANPGGADMEQLARFAADGRLRTAIDQTYPLEALDTAFDHSRSGRTRGKIIVAVGAETRPGLSQ